MEKESCKTARFIAIFCVLLSVYLLAFCGIASTDDEQLFAVLTENLAFGNGYSALPLFGNDRLQGKTGSVEPLHPLLGIPAYLTAHHLNLGKAQILFLLPALYTALTGMLVAVIAEIKGAPPKTAVILALAYGLGTIAFPYARTNFREPLAALCITSGILFLELAARADRPYKHALYPLLGLSALILSALTKITTAVLIPIFLIAYLILLSRKGKKSGTRIVFIVVLTAILLIIMFFLLPVMFPASSLNRFSARFFDYLSYTLPRLQHGEFWSALAGLFFSPGKGLFVYSPVLLLALLTPLIVKKRRLDWLFFISPLLALAAVQAYIYNDDWWNITWGTRALLPALPMASLAALPALDRGFKHSTRKMRWAIIILLAASVLIQGGRLLASDPAYVSWAVPFSGHEINADTQWRLDLMPLYRHWQYGMNKRYSDLAWLHIPDSSVLPAAALILSASLTIWFGLRCLFESNQKKWHPRTVIALAILALVLTPISARNDMRYYSGVGAFNEAVDWVCADTKITDLVLIDSYLYPLWWHYFNFGCSGPEWLGLPYLHKTALGGEDFYPRLSDTVHLIRGRLDTGKNVFLIQVDYASNLLYTNELRELGLNTNIITSYDDQKLGIYQIID